MGMSIYSGAVASNKIAGKIGEESEQLSKLIECCVVSYLY